MVKIVNNQGEQALCEEDLMSKFGFQSRYMSELKILEFDELAGATIQMENPQGTYSIWIVLQIEVSSC